MPWKASSVMEEKLRFVFEYEQHEQTMRDVCQSFGISRETGYHWLRRYQTQGVMGLAELDRAARHHPNQTSEEIEQLILDLRQAHMRWGPRKLKRILERDQPGRRWPAASTMGEMLRREGLVVPRRKRRRTAPYIQPGARRGTQPGVVRGFQGLVSHRRRPARRSADHLRRPQPLSAALPGGGEDGHGAGASHLRSGVS